MFGFCAKVAENLRRSAKSPAPSRARGSVNADAIQGLGEAELEAVIEEIKGDEGVDWMMHS
jgi:hypothetical protein